MSKFRKPLPNNRYRKPATTLTGSIILISVIVSAVIFKDFIDSQNDAKPSKPYVKQLANERFAICKPGIILEHCARRKDGRHDGIETFSTSSYAVQSETWSSWETTYREFAGAKTAVDDSQVK